MPRFLIGLNNKSIKSQNTIYLQTSERINVLQNMFINKLLVLMLNNCELLPLSNNDNSVQLSVLQNSSAAGATQTNFAKLPGVVRHFRATENRK